MAIREDVDLLKLSKPAIITSDEAIDLTTNDYDNDGGITPFYVEALVDCTVSIQLIGSDTPVTRYYSAGECKPILVSKVFKVGTSVTTGLIAQK